MTTPTPSPLPSDNGYKPCDDPACERCHPPAYSPHWKGRQTGKSRSLEQVAELARKAIWKSSIRNQAEGIRESPLTELPQRMVNMIAQAHGAHSAERDAEGVLVWIKQSVLVPCRIDPLHPIVDNPEPTVGDLIDGLKTPPPEIDINTAARKMIAVLKYIEQSDIPLSKDTATITTLTIDALCALNGRPLPKDPNEFVETAMEFTGYATEPAAKPAANAATIVRTGLPEYALDQLIQTLKAGRATGASVTP